LFSSTSYLISSLHSFPFFFQSSPHHRHLHSFPTRRSSDLLEYLARVVCAMPHGSRWEAYPDSVVGTDSHTTMVNSLGVFGWGVRSEEHTSELQSRFDLVCRLLLEKKKKKNDIIKISPLSVYSDIFAFLVSC